MWGLLWLWSYGSWIYNYLCNCDCIFVPHNISSNRNQTVYNKGNAKRGVSPRLTIWPCDLDLWPWKSIGFQILLRTMYVPSLVKIHWKMLILECSQGCYAVKIWHLDLWPWKSIGFQTLIRTKYVPSLAKIHWMMLILVFTRMSHGKNLTQWPWPLTLKINRVPDSLKD
jgi:hypothetical protein